MPLDTGTILQISRISCYGLPGTVRAGFAKKPGKFYLKIIVDDQKHQTPVAKDFDAPVWKDPLLFSISEDSIVTIGVYSKRPFPFYDSFLGELILSLDDFGVTDSGDTQTERINQRLSKEKDGKRSRTLGSVELIIRCSKSNMDTVGKSALNLAGTALGKASEDLETARSPGAAINAASTAVGAVGKIIEDITTVVDLWAPLFESVGLFIKIVDGLADIHPYAAIAWAVLSQPLKAVITQNKRDQEIRALLDTMNRIYQVVLLAQSGPREMVEAHRHTAVLLCQQTTECALFVRDYASRGFTTRMFISSTNGYDSKIASYQATFAQLEQNFLGRGTILTQITVFQISTKTDEVLSGIAEISEAQNLMILNDVPYATGQAEPSKCHPGTRSAVIVEIVQWFAQPLNDLSERVFWLYGVAGCGKSTIAHTIACQLRAQHRCVSFFFNASRQAEAGLDRLFSTITQDLADLSTEWKASLIGTLKATIKARKRLSITTQFENLVLSPARHLDGVGPVLIIIDALDESGSREERAALLQILGRIPELPTYFRFLITSRPEPDIVDALGEHTWVRPSRLDETNEESTNQDIRSFVRHRLMQTHALQEVWCDEWVDGITARSDQLFHWAFTACKYINGDGSVGCDPLERLNELLTSDSYFGLDGLYKSILDRVITFQPGDKTSRRFVAIMGRTICVREPLSLGALSALWSNEEDRHQVKNILSPLGSLLRGVSGQQEPIQPLHVSFIDFLKDQKRSGKYWIPTDHQDEMISRACLREMRKVLTFNICKLETSYVFNKNVTDLGSRLLQCIPSHISYACRFWAHHLCVNVQTKDWCDCLYAFMRRYFFFWLEALSLLNQVERAHIQLSMLRDWLQSMENCQKLKQLISDSLRFVDIIAPMLRQSTPHLYLSALSFIPRDSPLSESYLPAFPGSIAIENNNSIRWSAMLLSIDTSSEIYSVALSPNGKRIVSGANKRTWSIWDSETGNPVVGPVSANADVLYSVAFSPGGKHVASGSRYYSVGVWDAESGAMVSKPLFGHTRLVRSITFSPNGQHIASGSFDRTVRIWDWRLGNCIRILTNEHISAISSIVFYPDGKRIASGTQDRKVIIWDVESGYDVTLFGHDDVVEVVALSPDGKYIASGSRDKTIILWNAGTGERILGPLFGHTNDIYSVAFSPDSYYMASGSRDTTVRVWDARTGVLIAGPFKGHGNSVFSVVFSPDGKRIISGPTDGTIKVWNVDSGKDLGSSPDAHTLAVSSVVYSPDGDHFATASWDGTMRLWHSATGTLVRKPYQSHTSEISSVAFSPDGKQIVSGSMDNSIRIWNIKTGEHIIGHSAETDTATIHSDGVRSVAFSPDGKYVASGSKDRSVSVRIWDAKTGKLIGQPFLGHTGFVNSVVFSPNSTYIVSCSDDKTIRIWDTRTGKEITQPSDTDNGWFKCLAFSSDGTLLALV